ncbi:MAG: HD-GYP domain-containing protein [Firmicutes bacterium]|nr:HD-GYP domain-containing protein [Bacillota bacterium]
MLLLSIDNIKRDMKLAKNIYAADGRILLGEGMILTDAYIDRLKQLNITSVYITDDRIGKVEVDELVKIQTKVEAVKVIQEVLSCIPNGKNWSGQKVRQAVSSIMEDLINHRKVLFDLVDIRALNDYTFFHSLGVCILSLMTGLMAGYDNARLTGLGMAAILHDVGKTLIPDQVLNKLAQLTPDEYLEVQKHTLVGYDLLRQKDDINSEAALVAIQHHERMDGSGYPNGLKGPEIHEFAKIVAIADVYDALSTDRVYRKRWMPHQVIEYIRDKGKALFDPDFCKIFLENIAPFPIGSMVLLNNGEKAIVIKVTKDLPARPVVKVIEDQEGTLLNQPFDIDLKWDLTRFISRALRDEEA